MAYIYQIINDINQKIYIGKTEFSIEKRFKEHCKDAFRDRNENRPLYAAMRKYGIEHFHIELLEETDNPEEREQYWIEQKRSFKHGYNATLGGDGKRYLDYDLIIFEYGKCHNQKEVANKLNISVDSVRKVLHNNNVEIIKTPTQNKKISQFSLDGNYIRTFISGVEAAKWISNHGLSHGDISTIGNRIRECANGKRKTAYSYKWEFA